MNDCPNGEMRDLLPDLLHDRLEGAELAAVEAHVASCADCRAELALLTGMRSALRRAPSVDTGRILAAIEPAHGAPMHGASARRGWGGWRAAAAVAAITLGGTAIAVARHEPATGAAPAIAVTPRVTADAPFVSTTHETSTVTVATRAPSATRRGTRQLAVSGDMSDLSDRELAALLGDLESLDVLPSADVDAGALVPVSGSGEAGEVL